MKNLSEGGREVIFDAEHFFDGYAADPDYAKRVILAAYKAGAGRIVLCDTNGATLPWEIEDVVARVATEFPYIKFGIHCHNDMGTAEAATSAAVRAGAVHVQGTVSGVARDAATPTSRQLFRSSSFAWTATAWVRISTSSHVRRARSWMRQT